MFITWTNIFRITKLMHISNENCKAHLDLSETCDCKVARVEFNSVDGYSNFTLDVNIEVYPVSEGEKVDVLILKIEDQRIQTYSDYKTKVGEIVEDSLFDKYDHILFGSIFHAGRELSDFFFYASFGGLLLKLFCKKSEEFFESITTSSDIFLFVKKI